MHARGCSGTWVAHWQRRDAVLHAHAVLRSTPSLSARLRTYQRRDGEPALHVVGFVPGGGACSADSARRTGQELPAT
jgi:hypothetical protein